MEAKIGESSLSSSAAAAASSHGFCEICVEKKESNELVRIDSCSHSFCADCITKQVTVKIQDKANNLVVTCPGLDCKGVLEMDTCMPVIPKEVFERWSDALIEAMIDDSQKFYCPFKDCSAMLVKDGDGGVTIRESECPICRRLFCAQCNVPWHSGRECEEIQRLNVEERGREDLMVRQVAKEENCMRCPDCKFSVGKTDDLLLITFSENQDVDDHSDEKYVEELQFQEALMAAYNQNSKNEIGESSSSSHSFCEICRENKERDDMFNVQICGHTFCSDCISQHVEVKIRDKVSSITCPDSKCNVVLEPDTWRWIISKNLLDQYDETLCQLSILDSHKFYCPLKDCSALLVNDPFDGGDEVITESFCPECRRWFCAVCRGPWHSGIGCDEFLSLVEDERGSGDVEVLKLAKENKWNRCRSCRMYVEKDGGCHHITCRCGDEWCYECGEKWSATHGGCQRT